MAEPTKEELEMMMRMILGDKYDPDFDPRKLGKREDAAVGPSPDWDPKDTALRSSIGSRDTGLSWGLGFERLRRDRERKSGPEKEFDQRSYVKPVPSMTAEEVQKLEPGLEGSYPFLSMAGGAKGTRSLLKAIYREAAKAAKPPETVMQVRKGEDYLPTLKERPGKEGKARRTKRREVAKERADDWLRSPNFSAKRPTKEDIAKAAEKKRINVGRFSKEDVMNPTVEGIPTKDYLKPGGQWPPDKEDWEDIDPKRIIRIEDVDPDFHKRRLEEIIEQRLEEARSIIPKLEKLEAKDVYDPRTDSYMTWEDFYSEVDPRRKALEEAFKKASGIPYEKYKAAKEWVSLSEAEQNAAYRSHRYNPEELEELWQKIHGEW